MTTIHHDTKSKQKKAAKKPMPKAGRRASFKDAQREIIAKFGPTFEKLSK